LTQFGCKWAMLVLPDAKELLTGRRQMSSTLAQAALHL
jgi:hypothetical protein